MHTNTKVAREGGGYTYRVVDGLMGFPWSCDFSPQPCDLIWGEGQKIWLHNQVTWPNSHGHVTWFWGVRKFDYVSRSHDLVMWLFSHGHMAFFGGKKVDYIIRSHDQIPTVTWPHSYGQVGNWTHNPNLVIGLYNKNFYVLENSK